MYSNALQTIFDHGKQTSWTLIRPGPKVIKLFSCSTNLSTKFILLINVKMQTNIGILTFISMINTTSERLKARNFFICFYEQLKFHAQLSWAWKKIFNLGVWVHCVSEVYTAAASKVYLTCCILMDSSFWFDTINFTYLGVSGYNFHQILYFFVWRSY